MQGNGRDRGRQRQVRGWRIPALGAVMAGLMWLMPAAPVHAQEKASDSGSQSAPAKATNATSAEGSASKDAAEGSPKIVVEPTSLHIGEVYYGEKGTGKLIIRNEGTAPLIILDAKGNCGCTVPRLEEKDRTVAPGSSVELSVTLTPTAARAHTMKKRVTIRSNDPVNPTVIVPVSCDVLVGVEPDPPRVLFKDLVVGDKATQKVKLISRTGDPFRIEAIETIRGPFTVEFDSDKEGTEHELTITVDSARFAHSVYSRLDIRTTHPRTPKLSIPVQATLAQLLQVRPRYFNLGTVTPGTEVEKEIVVESKTKEPVTNVSFRLTRYPNITVTTEPHPTKENTWLVRFRIPEELAGQTLRTGFEVTTNVAKAGSVRGSLRVQVQEDVSPVPEFPDAP